MNVAALPGWNPAAARRWNPMRSASYSFSRVKLSFCWMLSAWALAIAAETPSPLLLPPACDASTANARPASESSQSFFWLSIMRAMWRCVTCDISCESTLASSDSLWASRINPVLMPM